MNPNYRHRINASALLCVLVSGCIIPAAKCDETNEPPSRQGAQEATPKPPKSPGELLLLELRPRTTPSDRLDDPPVQIFITNKGDTKVTLLEPSFRSHVGLRVPVVTWQVFKVEPDKSLSEVKPAALSICVKEPFILDSKDFFDLAPGESRDLKGWSHAPRFEKPGLYRVRIYYRHDPGVKLEPWQHAPLIKRIRQSTQCALLSDELEFTVPGPTAKQ